MRHHAPRGLRHMAVGLAVFATVFLAACGGGASTEGTTAAAPQAPSLHDDIETCSACHETIFAAWQKSRHAQSWKSETFRVDFRRQRPWPNTLPTTSVGSKLLHLPLSI